MLFDTHAHYDSRQFAQDWEPLLESMPQNGVGLILNPGCDMETSRRVLELCDRFPFVYGAVGIHPEEADGAREGDIDRLREMARHPKVKAIGEIGLDYYWKEVPRETQQHWLRLQLELARELQLPVIIHDREAHGDCMDILREYPDLRVVFHCFSGSVEMAREIVRRGWYLSFTGVITFPNSKKAVEVVEEIPLERMFIETDSPYMAPVPYRGKRNSSLYVHRVAERIAEIKGLSLQEVEDTTTRCARAFFDI
ncbi:MAG: TatD family hydrolase [Eubacteriales bacterium]